MMRIQSAAAIAAMSIGASFAGGYDFATNQHEPRDLKYTDSGKPLSKRRSRRLRAKAKQEQQQ